MGGMLTHRLASGLLLEWGMFVVETKNMKGLNSGGESE